MSSSTLDDKFRSSNLRNEGTSPHKLFFFIFLMMANRRCPRNGISKASVMKNKFNVGIFVMSVCSWLLRGVLKDANFKKLCGGLIIIINCGVMMTDQT